MGRESSGSSSVFTGAPERSAMLVLLCAMTRRVPARAAAASRLSVPPLPRPRRDQPGNQVPSQCPGRSRDEDSHDLSFRLLLFLEDKAPLEPVTLSKSRLREGSGISPGSLPRLPAGPLRRLGQRLREPFAHVAFPPRACRAEQVEADAVATVVSQAPGIRWLPASGPRPGRPPPGPDRGVMVPATPSVALPSPVRQDSAPECEADASPQDRKSVV